MSTNTKIEWAHHTFNPWVGCTKVSPACVNCYAEGWAKRSGQVVWGGERKRTSLAHWNLPLKWNRAAMAQGIRYRVFCASLADVFDNEVPVQWLHDLFTLIRHTPNLDWLLLTKRIGNWKSRLQAVQDHMSAMISAEPKPRSISDEESDAMNWVGAWVDRNDIDPIPENVWLGATICNQAEADRDIPKLMAVPARKRFLSMEPLLGPVDLERWLEPAGLDTDLGLSNPGIDWGIVGFESGPNARPGHPDHVRNLRDQFQAAGQPFFFKQWGEYSYTPTNRAQWDDGTPVSPDLHPVQVLRVGKKSAGRLLDGREWNEVPS